MSAGESSVGAVPGRPFAPYLVALAPAVHAPLAALCERLPFAGAWYAGAGAERAIGARGPVATHDRWSPGRRLAGLRSVRGDPDPFVRGFAAVLERVALDPARIDPEADVALWVNRSWPGTRSYLHTDPMPAGTRSAIVPLHRVWDARWGGETLITGPSGRRAVPPIPGWCLVYDPGRAHRALPVRPGARSARLVAILTWHERPSP